MTQAHSLTIDEILKELNIGRATLKFILKRFSQWLPFDRINGDHHYSPQTIPTLIRIRDLLDQGMLPSEIETLLAQDPTEELTGELADAFDKTDPLMHRQESPQKDIRMSKDALGFIQSLFTDIKGHQSRIAVAHEKRAAAEERKAVAIEKRAAAEEKKADAMNNIAAALQEMNRQRATDTETWEIAGQAAQALSLAETGDPDDTTEQDVEDLFDHPLTDQVEQDDLKIDDLSELVGDNVQESDDLIDLIDIDPASLEPEDIPLDDLASLVDEPDLNEPDLDDLSALTDITPETEPQGNGLDDLLETPAPLPEPDDLTLLVDEVSDSQSLDDLHSLVDDKETAETAETMGNIKPDQKQDDLSLLIDTEEASGDGPLDDLSLLVASDPVDQGNDTPSPQMDDLSLLVDQSTVEVDDLSTLVDDEDIAPQAPIDDLSALVDKPAAKDDTPESDSSPETSPSAQPSLRPEISPEQDPGKYKAAVMKIIIQLKNQGLTAQETTDRLNQDQVPTLSGKPNWREKAIQKIYGFIDSAK